ncbi:fimbrial protein [Providencia rettgeri]
MYNKKISIIKKRLTFCIVIILIGFMNISFADLASINLRITANLVSNTCVVSAKSKNQVIDMKTWASKYFDAASTKETPPIKFTIDLENCGPSANMVNVIFSGDRDSKNNQLFALSQGSTAKNLGISILDENYQQIIPNSKTKIPYMLNGKNNVSLIFYAKYVVSGSPVTAGSANSEATFELEYL